MTPQNFVDTYFGAMRNADVETVVGLFADDAVFAMPDGKTFEGRNAIRSAFTGLFAVTRPNPQPNAPHIGEGSIAVEVVSQVGEGRVRTTCNVYHFDDAGRIKRLHSYSRG